MRGAIKFNFGDDSLAYERVGGTRSSERQKPAKKLSRPLTVQPPRRSLGGFVFLAGQNTIGAMTCKAIVTLL